MYDTEYAVANSCRLHRWSRWLIFLLVGALQGSSQYACLCLCHTLRQPQCHPNETQQFVTAAPCRQNTKACLIYVPADDLLIKSGPEDLL
jgi:hypothetical protein